MKNFNLIDETMLTAATDNYAEQITSGLNPNEVEIHLLLDIDDTVASRFSVDDVRRTNRFC